MAESRGQAAPRCAEPVVGTLWMLERVSFQIKNCMPEEAGILCLSKVVLSSYCFWSLQPGASSAVWQAKSVCPLCRGLPALPPGHLPGDGYLRSAPEVGVVAAHRLGLALSGQWDDLHRSRILGQLPTELWRSLKNLLFQWMGQEHMGTGWRALGSVAAFAAGERKPVGSLLCGR